MNFWILKNKDNVLIYLQKITKQAIKIFNKNKKTIILNMPIDKKKFLNNSFPGFTEFFSHILDKKNNENMLLYNDKSFSVCPLTTHIEIKKVEENITKKKLKNCILNVVNFYKILNKKIEINVLGLNPHASVDLGKETKDKNIIFKIVKEMKKKGINIVGPISADTAFMKNSNYKVFIGMYHDQVLIPFKTINKFNGINITIGKKILRLSPNHGTAKNMKRQKNNINNLSFKKCIDFCSIKLNA